MKRDDARQAKGLVEVPDRTDEKGVVIAALARLSPVRIEGLAIQAGAVAAGLRASAGAFVQEPGSRNAMPEAAK